MIEPKKLNEIIQTIASKLPPAVKQAPDEAEKLVRDVLNSAFDKMDLVTREEFDTQMKVLLRTREKLEALEIRVRQLETDAHH